MKHIRGLILLVCLAICSSALAQEEIELKIYDVASDNRDEIFSALQSIVGGGVQMLPNGQLLVRTTAEFHQQVATVLDAIAKSEAEPTPRVTLQYWIVLGLRPGTNDADTPAALNDVLAEIRQVHGPLSFRMLGNATLVTDSGMTGRTDGEVTINQVAYVQGERLNAHLDIRFAYTYIMPSVPPADGQADVNVAPFINERRQGVDLNTSMEQGEFVVVGENSITDNIVGLGEVDGTVFYIVHWPLAD